MPTTLPTARRALSALALRTVAGLACAGASLACLATPVTVSIGGLPAGLTVQLKTQRNVCPDGMGWITNPAQALTEQTFSTFDRVTLPGGGFQLRQRLVTRYTASFDTPVTPPNSNQLPEIRCSRVGIGADQLRFTVQVAGADDSGRAAQWSAALGSFPMDTPVALNTTLEARTTALTLSPPAAPDLLPRGMRHSLTLNLAASGGTVSQASVSLLRPLATSPLLRTSVARLFQREDGRACIQAQGSTRCLGDAPGPLMHGGVELHGIVSAGGGQTSIQFSLLQDFPVGPVALRASAQASDLPYYQVDGSLTAMDLLPWQALERSFTVQ